MSRLKRYKEEDPQHLINSMGASQKTSDNKLLHSELTLKSSRGAQLENAKAQHTLLQTRPKSNEKVGSAASLGSTGGSQSYASMVKKPNLKLNMNLSNPVSITMPQTTANIHSTRMTNYQTPHS